MNKHDYTANGPEQQKNKIRERYKGIDMDTLDIIPAVTQASFHEDTKEKRVAVYARVSTDDPRQTSSFELQKNHYVDVIARHSNWKLVEIYADEGITGTSTQHRRAFNKMIADCRAGKIDLIMTKSVARFARNSLDTIGHARQLKALNPPVGIFFEAENIFTLNDNSEMSLSMISVMAQEESHNKSEIMNASIEMRFRRGILLTPPLLGYDLNDDGSLVINEKEANTVRLIFFMYLYGYNCQQIADTLKQFGQRTKKNSMSWTTGSVLQILQNERHCGDVLARKTWTPNYLDHKSRKNRMNKTQYRYKNHHDAIVSRDDFLAVQRLISNAKYGNKGFLPQLSVIDDGALKGFVLLNPRWAAFKAEDYVSASDSAGETDPESEIDISEALPKSGGFDLRGYEIARSQFFNTAKKLSVSFSSERFQFSAECISKLNQVAYVEMLIHPRKQLFAIRPSSKENRNAIKWIRLVHEKWHPSYISGAAFIPTLYAIFEWMPHCKYRIRGMFRQQEGASVIVFDMRETEIFIPANASETDAQSECQFAGDSHPQDIEPFTFGISKDVLAYPVEWASGFGRNYYVHAQARELEAFNKTKSWDMLRNGTPVCESQPLKVTGIDEIEKHIRQITDAWEPENESNG